MAGRPREFDRDLALQQAMLAFWQHGYEGTSMADLVAATGLASARLYAAFGSKEGLFREAVERYDPDYGAAFSLYAVHRVRGRVRDFLRREGNVDLPCLEAETESHETAKELLMDEQPSVAELAEHHALVGVVGDAMERLPTRERLVLEGVTIGGAGAGAMADALGVTPAHVYRLQKNGIRRIRGMLSRFMQHW